MGLAMTATIYRSKNKRDIDRFELSAEDRPWLRGGTAVTVVGHIGTGSGRRRDGRKTTPAQRGNVTGKRGCSGGALRDRTRQAAPGKITASWRALRTLYRVFP